MLVLGYMQQYPTRLGPAKEPRTRWGLFNYWRIAIMSLANRDDMKSPLSLDQQIDLLESRGLVISRSRESAKKLLQQTNYYRLSAYSIGLRDCNNCFIKDTTLEKIYAIYCFDEDFRHLLFAVIEPIEIRLRAELSYNLAIKYGNCAHLNSSIANDKGMFFRFLSTYYTEVNKKKETAFVSHHISKYGELPIWAAVELLSFGSLSMFYSNLNLEDRKVIADNFKTDVARLPGWLECFCEVRNTCAHSSRIYNRIFSKTPKMYSEYEKYKGKKIFQILIIIYQIYQGKGIKWQYFYDNLVRIINLHKQDLDLSLMEFPENWEAILAPQS